MSSKFGIYKDDYEECFSIKKTKNGEIFRAFNKKSKMDCNLKLISKEQLKKGDYDFLIERIKKEEEIMKLCNSENTVKFYRRIETEDYIILELEECDGSLEEYLKENDNLKNDKNFFKDIVIGMAKAFKTLNEKAVMHRDIKPANIYYKVIDNSTHKKIVKLGDFGCAIYKKDNISDSIGSFLYSAPEMAKDLEYDEKIDLWSLGVTLYELYFGELPYGPNANFNAMMNAIYDEENFIFQKTFKKGEKPKFITIDILFKRLLTIEPENRMTFNEFFSYVFSNDFMKENVFFVNNNEKYKDIYNIIINEKDIEYQVEYKQEALSPTEQEKYNAKQINLLVKGGQFPDIMNFSNASAEGDNKINNIIYYDENVKKHLNEINKDSDIFERATPGAFILCTNLDSLKLVREEILDTIKKDKRISFNLITTGSQCKTIMNLLKKDKVFDDCIKNVCIFCMNYDKWKSLKDKYEKIYAVYTSRKQVIQFIKEFSSENIKAYPLTKVITYNEYKEKYRDRHFEISKYYGDLTPESFKQNMEKMDALIEKDNKEKKLRKKIDAVKGGFLTFDINQDLKILDNLIIKEYTKETFYGDLNKWLMNSNFDSFETVAYFTARLMYSLNSYGKNGSYYDFDKKELKRGTKLSYTNLLPYERAKGKFIIFSAFTSTTESELTAIKFSGRKKIKEIYKNKLKFSVIFFITNACKKNWISNGVNIQNLSVYDEKEILYQPFSFYYVRDVQIDEKNYKADIYLETVGKYEILEEQIKNGKFIILNEKDKILEVSQ